MRKTAILFADTIILFQFDKIFDLTDRQEEYLKKKIDDWLNWIKTEKKSDIRNTLFYIRKSSLDGIDPAEQKEIRYRLKSLMRSLAHKIKPDLIPFLKSLSDKQIQTFAEYLSESNDDIRELAESKDYKREKCEQLEERLEKLYGFVNKDQLTRIYNFSATQEHTKKYLNQKIISQEFSLEMLRQGREDPIKMSNLIQWFLTSPKLLRPKTFINQYETLSAAWRDSMSKTNLLMNKKQRKNFTQNIDDLINDLDGLWKH